MDQHQTVYKNVCYGPGIVCLLQIVAGQHVAVINVVAKPWEGHQCSGQAMVG